MTRKDEGSMIKKEAKRARSFETHSDHPPRTLRELKPNASPT
jgi:hypothetical protein